MHKCATLFNRFFALVDLEEDAIAAEDIEKVNALAAERAAVLQEAWGQREGFDEETLRTHILHAGKCQEKLTEAASVLHAKFRQQQKNGRKQSRYFSMDRNLHAELQKSFYCDKVS